MDLFHGKKQTYQKNFRNFLFSLKIEYPKYYSYQGRKVSKKISLSKRDLIEKIYNQYSLDEYVIKYHHNKNFNKKIVLPNEFKKVCIEIGFGNGDFLIKNAISYPEELFIGIEVYLNGIAKVLTNISKIKLENIILSHLNSIYFLEAIPYRSVDKIFIINPDPWIKKKHYKRRLISSRVIKLLINLIKSKNSIYITTDSELYLKDMVSLISRHVGNIGTYDVRILSKNDRLYGISRYQRKAIEKGEKIYQLIF